MRIECPECGAKYTFDKPIPLDKKYTCRKCGKVVTFRQVAETKEAPAQAPVPKAPPAIRQEVKREPPKEKPRPVKQEVTKTQAIQTKKRFSTSFLVIVGILVVVVIVIAIFMFRG